MAFPKLVLMICVVAKCNCGLRARKLSQLHIGKATHPKQLPLCTPSRKLVQAAEEKYRQRGGKQDAVSRRRSAHQHGFPGTHPVAGPHQGLELCAPWNDQVYL